MKKKQFWLGIAVALALISIAAVHWYTDVPNNGNPAGNYAISMDTQDHAPGGTPYNWISIDQLQARIGSASTAGFLRNANDIGTAETFAGGTTFTGPGGALDMGAGTSLYGSLFGGSNLQPSFVTVTADPNDPNTRTITAGLNITITDGGPGGSLLIASSAIITITTVTNNTFVNTNVTILTSNAYFNIVLETNVTSITETNNTFVNTNLFISVTNYSTNLFFISGKGNTLVITNVFVAVPGSLVNSNSAINSAVVTDATHAYTNAVNAHGVFTNSATGPPLWGLLQNTELVNSSLTIAGTANQVSVSGGGPVSLGGTATLSLPSPTLFPGKIAVTGLTNTGETSMQGVETNTTMGTGVIHSDNLGKRSSSLVVAADISAGITPTLNLSSSTNLIYRYTTNAVTTIVMTFGQSFMTNVSTANITFTAVNAQDLAALETCCLFATNSSGSDHTITLPNGIGSPGYGSPPVITVTNKQSCWIYVQHYGNQATNCWFIPSY